MFKVGFSYKKSALSFAFILLSFISFAQEKSTNIQTISGKKYYIHKVEKGQSLYAISKLYNVDINVILADNDDAIDGISAGQELKILIPNQIGSPTKVNPGSTIDTNRFTYHKVAKRETIYAIAKKYSITEQRLNELNPDLANGLKPGQLIVVAEKKPAVVTATVSNEPKKDSVIVKPTKKAYNIGLFLPFKLNELETIDISNLVQSKVNFPQIQSLAIDFYLGFKRATDSLVSKDFEINLLLFDGDDKDSTRLEATCKSPEFKSLDLIFGPFYTSGFKVVSTYAKPLAIPVTAPVTQTTKILYNNNLISKITPSQYTLIESLAEYCIDSLKNNSTIFVINNANPKDVPYIKRFKQHYNDKLKELNLPVKDSVREVKGLAGLKSSYIPGMKNVVVLLSNNQVFLTDFITQLNVFAEKKDIVLAGWQNITANENIDQEYLNKLKYTFASPNNLNNLKSYSNLIREYQQQLSSDPSDYFFQGFDIAQFYLQNLKATGPGFINQLDKLPFESNYTRFKFYRPDASTGFENKGVYIFNYNNFQLNRTGWK